MKLSLAQVEQVAKLAQLTLSDQEKELFREQISSILEYAQRLQQVDTSAIPPTATVLPLENVMRDDEVRPSLPLADALAEFGSQAGDAIPALIELLADEYAGARSSAVRALRDITGQDLGEDLDHWQQWWDQQQE